MFKKIFVTLMTLMIMSVPVMAETINTKPVETIETNNSPASSSSNVELTNPNTFNTSIEDLNYHMQNGETLEGLKNRIDDKGKMIVNIVRTVVYYGVIIGALGSIIYAVYGIFSKKVSTIVSLGSFGLCGILLYVLYNFEAILVGIGKFFVG